MIDPKARFLETLRQHFRDVEFRAAEVLKAAQTNEALMVALVACLPRISMLRIGKLLARLRDKGHGDHILEGSIDLHTKTWVYTVEPWVLPKPKVDPIKAAEAALAFALEIAETPPIDQMTAAEVAKLVAGGPTTRILSRIENEKEREVARAQRALDRAKNKAETDSAALELQRTNREQQKALHRYGGPGIPDYAPATELQSGNPGYSPPTKPASVEPAEKRDPQRPPLGKKMCDWSMAELAYEKSWLRENRGRVVRGFGSIGSSGLWPRDWDQSQRGPGTDIFGWPTDSI